MAAGGPHADSERSLAGRADYCFKCRTGFTSAVVAGYRLCFPDHSVNSWAGLAAGIRFIPVGEHRIWQGLAGRWGHPNVSVVWAEFFLAGGSKEEMKVLCEPR